MQFLTEKEWIFLNEIFHMIHDTDTLDEMRTNLLDLLTILIPNSSASFYLANNNSNKLFSDPVANNIERKDIINYLKYGEGLDYTVPIYKRAMPIAYKETDLFDSAIRERTEFFNEFLAHGLEYPMALCIAQNGKCYGALSLFRSKRMGDFSDRDVFILNQLHNHLATRIYLQEYKRADLESQKIKDVKHSNLLTSRELEILTFILEGLSNEEISRRLFIETGTVKKHIHNIYNKFRVKNRIQLLRIFL